MSNLSKSLLVRAGLAMLMSFGAFVAVSTATAAPAAASDPCLFWGSVCLYENINYSTNGGRRVEAGSNSTYHDGDTFNNGALLRDAVSSITNQDSAYWFVMYCDASYQGGQLWVAPGLSPNNLTQVAGCDNNWNDKGSSHSWVLY